jgi:hypothetical protein
MRINYKIKDKELVIEMTDIEFVNVVLGLLKVQNFIDWVKGLFTKKTTI